MGALGHGSPCVCHLGGYKSSSPVAARPQLGPAASCPLEKSPRSNVEKTAPGVRSSFARLVGDAIFFKNKGDFTPQANSLRASIWHGQLGSPLPPHFSFLCLPISTQNTCQQLPLLSCGPLHLSTPPVSWEESEGPPTLLLVLQSSPRGSGGLCSRPPPTGSGWVSYSSGPGKAGVQRAGPRAAAHILQPQETPNTRTRTFSPCYKNAFLNFLSYLMAWGREQLHFAQSKNKIHCLSTVRRMRWKHLPT